MGHTPKQWGRQLMDAASAWPRWPWVLRWGSILAVSLALLLVVAQVLASRVDVRRPATPIVNDVTQLNPIAVAAVATPTTAEEVAALVGRHPGAISIGGGRYSMGGQTAQQGALQLDLRQMNRILAIDTVAGLITVQPGVRWWQIQEAVDPFGFAVKIMQTYNDFTVGGSLSVNCHGRYLGQGPLILSVRSLKVVLADGSLVTTSPSERPELFYGVVGGYGGLGVIVEATLELARNTHVQRTNRWMPTTEYLAWFRAHVRTNPRAIFHNADIYPGAYDEVNAVTYAETDRPVTIPDRIRPRGGPYRLNRVLIPWMTSWPGGHWLRRHVLDPWLFRDEPVSWRNYEASYDVLELEPASRGTTTYVLQEYFVPIDSFDVFVPRLRATLQRHHVEALNVSIRHAKADPGSLLAWARTESFAFVLYYRQRTDEAAKIEVGRWTRELVGAAIASGGTYYLPYQPHATRAQFAQAYPRAGEFFALRRRLDPTNKFQNTLWSTYDPALRGNVPARSAATDAVLDTLSDYRRDASQTYLAHPEWTLVYHPAQLAAHLAAHPAHTFPYARGIGEYWANYREVHRLTAGRYPRNIGYDVMLGVIGTSYTVELALKGLYEASIGRFTAWTAGDTRVPEEDEAARDMAAYVSFIRVRPWYEYRFLPDFAHLWRATPLWGTAPLRRWERKLILSAELLVKAGYGELITLATHAAYNPEAEHVSALVTGVSAAELAALPDVRVRAVLDDSMRIVAAFPRYEAFLHTLDMLAAHFPTAQLEEVAGNDEIVLTAVVPRGWEPPLTLARLGYGIPVSTAPGRERVLLVARVPTLLPALRWLRAGHEATVDHVYDY